jgi:hypothetical protein
MQALNSSGLRPLLILSLAFAACDKGPSAQSVMGGGSVMRLRFGSHGGVARAPTHLVVGRAERARERSRFACGGANRCGPSKIIKPSSPNSVGCSPSRYRLRRFRVGSMWRNSMTSME